MANVLQTCPNCQCVWGFDEIQFQECDSCGYPHNDDDDDDVFDPDYIGPDPEDEGGLMGKDYREDAEERARIQRDMK